MKMGNIAWRLILMDDFDGNGTTKHFIYFCLIMKMGHFSFFFPFFSC